MGIRTYFDRYKSMTVMAKASLWALIAGVLQKGISVLATPIFTRILNTEEYAQYTLYQSWQDIFIIFVSMNVFNYATYTAMVKFENDKEGFISSAQTLVTLLSFIWMSVYFVIHRILGDILDFPLYIVILMFVDMLFFSAYNLWATRKRYEFSYKIMTIVSIILGVSRPVLGFILIKASTENIGYGRIYGFAIMNIVIGMVCYLVNIKKGKKWFSFEYWKYIFAFCIPLIPHFLSSQILSRSDRIMINKMCGTSDVAIYSLAYNLATLMAIVSDAVLTSITPWTYQCIKDGKREQVGKIAETSLLLIAGVNFLMILFAPEAVFIFAPSEYHEAIYIIPSIAASLFFIYLFNLFANIEYYYSETKYVAMASIIAAVVNVVLNYMFINLYGYKAAGYTTLISYICFSAAHYAFMRTVSRKHAEGYCFFDIKNILAVACIFVGASLAIIPLYDFIIIRYVIILGMVCFGFYKRELIINMLKKK